MDNWKQKPFLTKREVAKLLGLSVYTIDAWVSQRRELTYHKVGTQVRFNVEDIVEWLEQNKVQPETT
jgi:excisionase family DNA binding protein